MKSSFCIDLQRFMLIPTKFPLSRLLFAQATAGDAIVSYGINKKEDFTFVKSSLDMFVTPAGFKPATF